MDRAPEVTVLMPVRDAALWLDEALASLYRQSLQDYEIVAVDDGSLDESGAILAAHARSDDRLRVVSTGCERRGLVSALNVGLAVARGRYVARMDADDVAMPKRLEHQLEALERDVGLAAVSCRVEGFPAGSVGEGMQRYLDWQNALGTPEEIRRDRFVESPVVAPSLMLRTSFLRSTLDGWRDRGWPEDWDLVLRASEAGGKIARVPHVLHRWRQHPRQATRVNTCYRATELLRARAHFLARFLASAAGDRQIWLMGAGPVGKALAEALSREGSEIAGFADVDPRKIGNRVRRAGREWPVISMENWQEKRDRRYAVAAVGSSQARSRIRNWLLACGATEERDFVAAA